MTPARRAALASFRSALAVMQESLEAFAKAEDDYSTECYLTEAASFVDSAIVEIHKAEGRT